MKYIDFCNEKISALGLGAMRLPILDGEYSRIDTEQAGRMVDYAIEHGINYFDTAWGYHSGFSETFIGEALVKYPRADFNLADKFPGYDIANFEKVEEIFERQLEKCRVSYFDFYLLHSVVDSNIDAYLDPKYGLIDYLVLQKRNGRIRHLGFSAHADVPVMKRLLDAYGSELEFCQIQLNYLDWTLQDAKEKVELLDSYGIPVWVMEPLRGGKLAALSEENAAILRGMRPDEEIPAWAFRFLQTIPSVGVTLSGMSNMAQLEANIRTFEESKPLSETELSTLLGVAQNILAKKTLTCTGCRYCTSHCPQELDIPVIISLYNEHGFTGGSISPTVVKSISEDKRPDACIGCRSCEAVCPQQIKISEMMTDFARQMRE